jgi:hypothetical protein
VSTTIKRIEGGVGEAPLEHPRPGATAAVTAKAQTANALRVPMLWALKALGFRQYGAAIAWNSCPELAPDLFFEIL